jgi:hypothetical protein
VLVECGVQIDGHFRRKYFMHPSKVNRFRFEHNNKAVYVSAYTYMSEDIEESDLLGDFYIDFDKELQSDDDFRHIKEDVSTAIQFLTRIMLLSRENIRLYFSGSKGIHLIVPAEVLGVKPHKDLNKIYKSIVEEILALTRHKTIDIKIYDRRRLFRLPHSIHAKTGLYKIPLHIDEIESMSLDQIKTLASEQRILEIPKPQLNHKAAAALANRIRQWEMNNAPKKYSGPRTQLKQVPPCIKHLLETTTQRGNRNMTLAVLASFFRCHGLTFEEALTRLKEWNSEHCSPKLSIRELANTTESIYKNSKYEYGCSTLKMISSCDEKECPIK